MEKRKLVIIGAGGHGKVVADAAIKTDNYNEIVFLDDNINLIASSGFPVVGKSNEITKYINDFDVFTAIGNAKTRQSILENLQLMGANVPVIVHPDAVIGRNTIIGLGTVVMAGVVINSDSYIGKGCIINTSASIDHDCKVDDFAHVSVGVHLAGSVYVGRRTWIGIGACVSNNIEIVDDCIIGAGAVVIKDIKRKGTYIGVPAQEKYMGIVNAGGGVNLPKT